MDNGCNTSPADFAAYLQSMVQLDVLEKMTQDLDKELADSQRVMKDIKAIFDSVPKTQNFNDPVSNDLRHEDISNFLEADTPKLLMPDMMESSVEIDIDDVIAKMKGYAEDLNKNVTLVKPQMRDCIFIMENLDLDHYAVSLDQLSKRLANIKINKKNVTNNKCPELETKLEQLCYDVNMFTKMVQAKTAVSECNKNWMTTEQDNKVLHYDSIIDKILSGINEVTYLLQNKN